ncbi:MAG: hypothetical protein KDD34_04750 [Bdellovibrionales bacterium]|nr:hypothetical protein [Bdellovibrionales bacterium]
MPKKKVVRKSKRLKKVPPKKSAQIPVTKEMLFEVRDELKYSVSSLERKMESRFKKNDSRLNRIEACFKSVDARFGSIDARFESIDARFEAIDARFDKIDARFKLVDARFDKMESRFADIESLLKKVLSEVHRIGLFVEEQNARNKYVLDGYTSVSDRLDRIEKKIFKENV